MSVINSFSQGKIPEALKDRDFIQTVWDDYIEIAEQFKDPDFDSGQRAFYYARVIEIPTPRWTAYDAKRFGLKVGPEVPMTIQERAYTSPIWYNP